MPDNEMTKDKAPAGYRFELQQEGVQWHYQPAAGAELPTINAPGYVPALERAIAVIDHINRTPPHSATSAEIATALGLTRSHCHNILKTLTHFRWLRFDARAKTYEISSGILATISSFLGSPELDRVRTELILLARGIELPIVLVQPQADHSFVVIDKFGAPHLMDVSVPVGQHLPRDAMSTMRAYLAWQPGILPDWLREWKPFPHTRKSPQTAEDIMASLQETRARGYARSKAEFSEGLMAMSMPIFGRDGEVRYVFTCSGLIAQIEARETQIARAILTTAIAANHAILGQMPADFPRDPNLLRAD